MCLLIREGSTPVSGLRSFLGRGRYPSFLVPGPFWEGRGTSVSGLRSIQGGPPVSGPRTFLGQPQSLVPGPFQGMGVPQDRGRVRVSPWTEQRVLVMQHAGGLSCFIIKMTVCIKVLYFPSQNVLKVRYFTAS